jgi:putative membrane-bound dehydrogenase-like protein
MITTPLRRFALAALATGALAAPARAQFGPPNTGTGPKLPPTGSIARDTAYERKVLAEMKAPEGFTMTLYAGPPYAMYPTVVAPSPDGSVYVGVDLNLAQGAVKGRGRVMRFVDTDGDGRADRYTTFLDVDSPRGIVADGRTVYVLHPPNLTAYHDTNGDGIADDSTDIVKGIGVSLDTRSEDHATNNITLGPDGWIYIAVGDYGYVKAVGKDGNAISRHGGSLVRVRPDGTGLEIVTVGTRNIYDVGIDPFGHAFTRDNTNDGGGWDTRFHYLAPNANMGYPSLFRYFREEHMPSIADYGGGSGTAGLWVQDPGLPAQWNNALYTGDWTTNRIYHHVLTPKGASYAIEQHDFMTVPHAIDFALDGRSHLFVGSLIGGVFNYAGDTVGAIVRVSYPGKTPAKALDVTKATDAQLVAAVVSDNAAQRVWAQQELVRRNATSSIARLQQLAADRTRPREARASAIFTLKRLAGARATATLLRLAADPTVREVALRVLADDKRQLAGVPAALYVSALADTSFAVRVQALDGLVRLGAKDQAKAIVPLLTSPDSALAHLAVQSLAMLGARDVALAALTDAASSAALRTRSRQVLQQLHDAETVSALLDAFRSATNADAKREALLALARLSNIEAPWNGDWWGTHPSTVGPYFAPVAWSETPRIRPVLRDALLAANGATLDTLTLAFIRNRVLPQGAGPLLAAAGDQRAQVVASLVGTSQLEGAAVPLIVELDRRSPALHAAVADLLAGEPSFSAQTLPLARAAALDTTLSPDVRGRLVAAFAQLPGDAGRDAAVALFAQLTPRPTPSATPAGTPGPVEAAWRRYVGDFQRIGQLDYFITLANGNDPAQRTLADAVLVQIARTASRMAMLASMRQKVDPVIDAAWSDPAKRASLVDAIHVMRAESLYADKLKQVSQAAKTP